MDIYQSENLTIKQHDDMFIQEWVNSDLNADDFTKELKVFLSFYEKVKPKSVLWLQENFKLQIPPALYKWIEEDIVKRQYETGMTNLGFTVSSDMLSHLSVMASFEKIESVIQPHFFIDKHRAIDHLRKEVNRKHKIKYEVQRLNDLAKVNVELNFDLLPKLVNSIKSIEKEQEFINNFLPKIRSLTVREMEIFQLIIQGKSSREISTQLFIETSTVSTHRKKIIQKLHIEKPIDWFLIAKSFNLL